MKYELATQIRVTYRDVDMQQVVHNSHYLQFAEIARIEYLRNHGLPYQEVVQQFDLEMVLAESHCYYKQPAHFDDLLIVYVRIVDVGNSSFRVEYNLEREATEDRIAHIVTHHVCVDRETFEPVTIPEEVRKIFEG